MAIMHQEVACKFFIWLRDFLFTSLTLFRRVGTFKQYGFKETPLVTPPNRHLAGSILRPLVTKKFGKNVLNFQYLCRIGRCQKTGLHCNVLDFCYFVSS